MLVRDILVKQKGLRRCLRGLHSANVAHCSRKGPSRKEKGLLRALSLLY